MKRFWSKVKKTDDCWHWTGGSNGEYGKFWIDGKDVGAHRVAFIISKGSIPKGMLVCHSCDNPICVRPSHLRAWTPKQNSIDREKKGRGAKGNGAKLTEIEVRRIRRERGTLRSIGDKYGVTLACIWAVRARKNWKHI